MKKFLITTACTLALFLGVSSIASANGIVSQRVDAFGNVHTVTVDPFTGFASETITPGFVPGVSYSSFNTFGTPFNTFSTFGVGVGGRILVERPFVPVNTVFVNRGFRVFQPVVNVRVGRRW
jgi:hypothetical protein